MVTTFQSSQLPQLPRTKPIKISNKKYNELALIAKNLHCTLDEALEAYIEQNVKHSVIELPRNIDRIIDACVTCITCLERLDKSLQRHGLELVDLTGKYSKLYGQVKNQN